MMETDLIGTAAMIAFGLLVAAMVVAFLRLAYGPTLPDRIVSLDLIASLAIGIIITLVFFSGEAVFIDIALFIALIVFIGTVAISKYLKRRFYDN